MYTGWFKSLLIATGCLIFLFSLAFDWLHQGAPGIGFQQLVGMTTGLIIILVGSRYILSPPEPELLPVQLKRYCFLCVVYLSGILIVCLWPTESSYIGQNSLLGMNTFSTRDFALNVVGFIPLGVLILPLVKYMLSSNKIIMLVAITAVMGFSVSLVIEVAQYLWIPGRYSSAYDLVTNTFGIIIGALCWLTFRGRQLKSLKV